MIAYAELMWKGAPFKISGVSRVQIELIPEDARHVKIIGDIVFYNTEERKLTIPVGVYVRLVFERGAIARSLMASTSREYFLFQGDSLTIDLRHTTLLTKDVPMKQWWEKL